MTALCFPWNWLWAKNSSLFWVLLILVFHCSFVTVERHLLPACPWMHTPTLEATAWEHVWLLSCVTPLLSLVICLGSWQGPTHRHSLQLQCHFLRVWVNILSLLCDPVSAELTGFQLSGFVSGNSLFVRIISFAWEEGWGEGRIQLSEHSIEFSD